MKYRIAFILSVLSVAFALPSAAQNFWDGTPVTGSNVTTSDRILIRDVAGAAAGQELKPMTLAELVNVPGLFSSVADNTFSISKVNGLQAALEAKQDTITAGTGLTKSGTTISLNNTAVTPGSYTATNLTVDAQGRITAASNGSAGGGSWGSITGTLSSQTDLQAAFDAKLNSDGSVATLRTARLSGSASLATIPQKLGKFYIRKTRAYSGDNGNPNSNKGVTLALGDSVAIDIGKQVQRQLGYGGKNYHMAVSDSNQTGGGTALSDQWHRSPHGYVFEITGAQYMQTTSTSPMTAVAVSYLSGNGYGSFQLSYETNQTGGYTASSGTWVVNRLSKYCITTSGSPTVWVAEPNGLEVGASVTGAGITGTATVTAVNKNVSVSTTGNVAAANNTPQGTVINVASATGIAPNMNITVAGTNGSFANALLNSYVISVTGTAVLVKGTVTGTENGAAFTFTGNTVTLNGNASSSAEGRLSFDLPNSGSSSGSGTLNTNASGLGTGATATATVTSNAVTSVAITNGGSGYSANAIAVFSGGGGSGATGTVVSSGGVVTGITVTNGGSGYTSAPTVTILDENYCTAYILLPDGADRYNIKLTPTSGTVRLTDLMYECGGLGYATTNYGKVGGWFASNWAEGGKQISLHFSKVPQNVWDRALSWLNPDIITFKGLNDWRTDVFGVGGGTNYWSDPSNGFITRVMRAAPNALLVVAGSHPTKQIQDRDGGYASADDWMRDWCSENEAVFVDVRSNMPPWSDTYGDANQTGSDGVHIYNTGKETYGWGTSWVGGLVFNAIKPAIDLLGGLSVKDKSKNFERPVPGMFNMVKMFDDSNVENASDQVFSFVGAPRKSVSVLAGTIGTPAVAWTGGMSGFMAAVPTAITNNRTTALSLYSNGGDTLTFGTSNGGGLYGFAIGYNNTATTNYAKTQSGYRFRVPWNAFSSNGVIIEGTDTSAATDRTFGININSTDSAFGTNLWTWNPGSSAQNPQVIYHGRTNDSNDTTFTYAEPSSRTMIHTPVGVGGHSGGTAQAGSATTITLASGASSIANAYVGATVAITSGTGSGQSKTITAYNSSTKVATVSTWTTNPDNTSVYAITPVRVLGVIPSFIDSTAGEAAVGQWEVYYDESTGKVKVDPNP